MHTLEFKAPGFDAGCDSGRLSLWSCWEIKCLIQYNMLNNPAE